MEETHVRVGVGKEEKLGAAVVQRGTPLRSHCEPRLPEGKARGGRAAGEVTADQSLSKGWNCRPAEICCLGGRVPGPRSSSLPAGNPLLRFRAADPKAELASGRVSAVPAAGARAAATVATAI